MTNESISGFLNSIAEAKRAFDAEPDYQRQIRDLERDKQRMGETIAQRELRIHELKAEATTLTQALRSAEVERDDAGFRALEEADKVQNLLVTLRGFITDGLKVLSAVEGKVHTVVSQDTLDGLGAEVREWRTKFFDNETALQSLQDDMRLAQEQLHRPFATPSDTSSSQGEGTDHSFRPEGTVTGRWYEQDHADPISSAIGEGQREVDPTSSASEQVGTAMTSTASQSGNAPEGQSDGPFAQSEATSQSHSVPSGTAESETSAASPASQPERNRDRSTFFTGRRYYDVTYFVPLHQWLNEGGTEADYHWRPATEPSQFNRASHQS